jgi:hypothetical protein
VKDEGQPIYIASITPELDRFKDKLAFNGMLYGPGVSPEQPGLAAVPENLPVELDAALLGSMGSAYLRPPFNYDTCAFVDLNEVMKRFSDVLEGRCSEKLYVDADYKDRLRADTTSYSHWLYSFNHTAAKPGRYYLQTWLTDRATGALAQGKFEITLGPWIWYSYASKDMQSQVQSQGTGCVCAVNALAYSETNLDRLGELGSEVFVAELPGGVCDSPSPPASACSTQDRAPNLSNNSAVEWSGLFDLKGGSRYSWTFRAYADGGIYSYPDAGMNVFVAAATSTASASAAADAALLEQNPGVMVLSGGTLSIRPSEKQKPETIVLSCNETWHPCHSGLLLLL